jgi:hypothetical protein
MNWWWMTRNRLQILHVWRWRRVCRRGVVLALRRRDLQPLPAFTDGEPWGFAYTWRGARVGSASRGHLAEALSGPRRRPELSLSPEHLADLRAAYGRPQNPTRRAP